MPTVPAHRRLFICFPAALAVTAALSVPSSGQVVINEFLFRDSNSKLEFVEILNRSAIPVDVADFGLSDDRRNRVAIAPAVHLLAPGAYLVAVRDSVAFDARFSSPRIQVPSWPALNNGGDGILLWRRGVAIDSVFFDDNWGAYGQSIERVDPAAPPNHIANWAPSTATDAATPGRRNSVYRPDTDPPVLIEAEEWPGDRVILYLSEPVAREGSFSSIRFASGDRPLRANVSDDGLSITVDPWTGADLTAVTVDGLTDLSGNRAGVQTMTVARQPDVSDLVVNEVLFEPLADPYDGRPDQQEFVEIHSLAAYSVALRGMYLTGRTRETGHGDTLRSDDVPRRIHAGGFAYFFAAGSEPGSFREAFPATPPDSTSPALRVGRRSLLLDNTGDIVRLHATDGRLIDEVAYASSFHRPELSQTRGISIERISPSTGGSAREHWTSTVSPEGGTPGRLNSVALQPATRGSAALLVAPSPFSPDGDGLHDFAQIELHSRRASSTIATTIFDLAGRPVRRLTEGLAVGPTVALVWDGRDDTGSVQSTGVYIVRIEAVDTAAGDVRQFKAPVVLVHAR